jgi:hypothetical protein
MSWTSTSTEENDRYCIRIQPLPMARRSVPEVNLGETSELVERDVMWIVIGIIVALTAFTYVIAPDKQKDEAYWEDVEFDE